ncbi:MAG: transglycosylase SLT domain-containing protein [Bdellovibrionales bacterium]|nr:transglycosylase SLT domain-containing protein [Bdellovibrionales bacterium]
MFISIGAYAASGDLSKITLDTPLTTSENTTGLIKLKRLQSTGQNKACINAASKAESSFKKVKGWVLYVRLQCARSEYLNKAKSSSVFAKEIDAIWNSSSELLFGAASRKLRYEVVNTTLQFVEYDFKNNRKRAWKFIGQLLEAKDWLNREQKARLYKVAGELSLAESNLLQAQEYFEKSLIEQSSKAVQARYESVMKMIDPKIKITDPGQVDVSQIESTREELEIYDRMRMGLKTGDLIAATEDGVKLIQEFPGGKRADIAAREILGVYLDLAAKDDEKFTPLKERVLSEMRKVDGERQLNWAQTLFYREKYDDSLVLAINSLEKIEGPPLLTQALMLAGQSAHNKSDFKTAYKYYEIIVKKHAGTKLSAEALFRLGLLDFRDEKYAGAAARFERFLQLEHSTDFELSSLYWLWRAQQKISLKDSQAYADRLIAKYPLSYYGLRAQAEILKGKLNIAKSLSPAPEWNFNSTDTEGEIWQRFLILKKANWHDEARAELASFDEPQSASGKIVFAYLWSQIGDYYRSTDMLTRALNQDPTLVALNTIQVAYPLLYVQDIKKESKRYKIPPELVLGLIRQESTFRADVKSSAGALGLMQLMPATAKEVARDMRVKYKNLSLELINPAFNIRLGTQYLHRRIRYFNGHVPLALAAYNAGIGNIRGWMKTRTDLGGAEKLMSSNPMNELWIDELPWPETTGYIKSILRNYLVYKVLDQSELKLSDPVWNQSL